MPRSGNTAPFDWGRIRAKYKAMADINRELGEAIDEQDAGGVMELLDELEDDYLEEIRELI